MEFNKNYGKWFINDIRRAIDKYEMIKDGDKVAVALSGGKDSGFLLYVLAYLKKYSNMNFDLYAIHAKQFHDYDTSRLKEFCDSLDVPYMEEKMILENPDMTKNVCYMCGRLKRGIFKKQLGAKGITKVAYGHHATDVAETFLMNIVNSRKLGSFAPKVEVEDSDMVMIRPLLYLEEDLITKLALEFRVPILGCLCPYNNIRKNYKSLIKTMENELSQEGIARRVVEALENVDKRNSWEQVIKKD